MSKVGAYLKQNNYEASFDTFWTAFFGAKQGNASSVTFHTHQTCLNGFLNLKIHLWDKILGCGEY